MEKLTHTTAHSYLKLLSSLILLCMVSFSTNTYAAQDTTVFRIKVLQDSVYAGDTVDVEFYIGTGSANINILNILNQFEIEVATDTSLIQQARTTFAFDYNSLASFFGTTISNITATSTLDPILGRLNMKASSARTGRGDARVGKGKYIVQDNVAGRQNMKYSFTKSISKRLLGLLNLSNPVKVVTDSVLILGQRKIIRKPKPYASANLRIAPVDADNEVKIYPNPTTDYLQIEGQNISQYKLIAIDGTTISSDVNPADGFINIDMSKLNAGMYLLMLRTEENWNGHKIIKK